MGDAFRSTLYVLLLFCREICKVILSPVLISPLSPHNHFAFIHKVPKRLDPTPKHSMRLLSLAFNVTVEGVLAGRGGLRPSRFASGTAVRTRLLLAPVEVLKGVWS